jgi:hypothetical protein
MDEFPQTNSGVIPGSATKKLWIGGTIPYEVRLESGDWRPHVPVHEKQRDPLETMACVTFSHNNCLEIQYKFFGKDVNFSDRFLAKMSETTPQGNYLDKVADTSRKIGLVLESEWPNNPKAATWDEYYKEIPDDVKSKAVKQPIAFEEIPHDKDSLLDHLKQSPIQVTIPEPHPNHAVTLLHISGDRAYVQDHYSMQVRAIAVSSISYALKIVLNKPNIMEIFQIAGEQTLVVKNLDGKYYIVATSPDLYPYVAKMLGLEGKTFTPIAKIEVLANAGGTLEAGLTYISK